MGHPLEQANTPLRLKGKGAGERRSRARKARDERERLAACLARPEAVLDGRVHDQPEAVLVAVGECRRQWGDRRDRVRRVVRLAVVSGQHREPAEHPLEPRSRPERRALPECDRRLHQVERAVPATGLRLARARRPRSAGGAAPGAEDARAGPASRAEAPLAPPRGGIPERPWTDHQRRVRVRRKSPAPGSGLGSDRRATRVES